MKNEVRKELADIVHGWLTFAGNKLSLKYCEQEITTHPDYPAITAATDFLDTGRMEYQVVQADTSYINEFNYPALAHIKEAGDEYLYIIPNKKAWVAQADITQHWSGIIIFPEKNAKWEHTENDAAIKESGRKRMLFIAWCCVGLALFIASVYYKPAFFYNLFGFFSLSGIFISIAALGLELGMQSNTVKQVCGAVSKEGCEAVLKSKTAKGIFGITPAAMAVVYFTTQFILYFVAVFSFTVFSFLPFVAIAGLLLTGVSIYIQAVTLKQWCALCIGIAGTLALQAIISFFLIDTLTLDSVLLFACTYLFLMGILIPVKSLIKSITAAKPELTTFKKWKADPGLFITQWKQEQQVDTTIWKNDLVIGDKDAPIMITVACNPYCAPCAGAHAQLDEMLERFTGKLKVQLRLLCDPENEKDSRTIAVKAMLQQAVVSRSSGELQQMLTDWFKWMNYEKWTLKWNTNNDFSISRQLQQHTAWIADNNITHTPTFFINGRKIPGRYDLKDLEYLIPQLAHEMQMA